MRGGWPGWNGWNGWQRAARALIRHAVVPGPFGGSGEGLGAAVPLVGAHGRAPGHVAVPSFGVSEADVGPGPERGDSTRTAARAGPPEGYGGNLAPPHPAWGHVGARLGHPPQLRSGCQRSVAEFGRYVVCAGGSRPIHPNRGTGLPPKGLGGTRRRRSGRIDVTGPARAVVPTRDQDRAAPLRSQRPFRSKET